MGKRILHLKRRKTKKGKGFQGTTGFTSQPTVSRCISGFPPPSPSAPCVLEQNKVARISQIEVLISDICEEAFALGLQRGKLPAVAADAVSSLQGIFDRCNRRRYSGVRAWVGNFRMHADSNGRARGPATGPRNWRRSKPVLA